MAFITDKPKTVVLSTIGALCGFLLLAFAGISAVVASFDDDSGVSVSMENMLDRRLQIIGFITTTKYPSSFDSSDSSSFGSSMEPSKSSESGSLRSSDAPHVFRAIASWTGSIWLTTTISLLLQFIFAVLYYRSAVTTVLDDDNGTLIERGPKMETGRSDFDNSICDFSKNPWVCIDGFCCPMVRQAHTNAASGLCGFWSTMFCWCCCSWMTLGIGPSCLVIYWRMMLKSIMGVGDNPIIDFCLTLICPWLSICQMATALDNSMGYRMVGCCQVAATGYGYGTGMDQLMTGQP